MWTPEQHAALVRMAAAGLTGSEIARALGVTRNAVMAAVIDNALEAEIARERAEIAAREARLARLYRARDDGRPGPRLVDPQGRGMAAPPGL